MINRNSTSVVKEPLKTESVCPKIVLEFFDSVFRIIPVPIEPPYEVSGQVKVGRKHAVSVSSPFFVEEEQLTTRKAR